MGIQYHYDPNMNLTRIISDTEVYGVLNVIGIRYIEQRLNLMEKDKIMGFEKLPIGYATSNMFYLIGKEDKPVFYSILKGAAHDDQL